jgi:radical SAM superfamily enzyme YgiQ (UPF0313 family)
VKLLLVSTNQEKTPFPVAPLGALSVAAAAQRAGHQVEMFDSMFVTSPGKKLKSILKSGAYQAIGFSIRNLDNCLYARPRSYYLEAANLIRQAQSAMDLPIILGGSGFSLAPAGWMKRLETSYGIVGEGERAFVQLLGRLEMNQSPHGIPGVLYSDRLSGPPPQSAQTAPSETGPPAHSFCNYARYLSRGGFASLQTKRGCPFKCIFCVYSALEGETYRLRDIDCVLREIEDLKRSYRKCALFFTDAIFNSPRKHALALCGELARRGAPLPWMACCNPLNFDEELARSMAAAGCIGIEFTLDALTEKMLVNLKKPFSQADIRRALDAAAEAGLAFAVHLLFGGPGETAGDIHEGVRFLDSCPKPSAVFASLGIRIYPGTEIEQIAYRDGPLSREDDLFFPVFYLSPALDRPLSLLDEIAKSRPEWSTPTDWTGWTMQVIQKIVNRTGARPQWRDVRNYGRYMRR